MNANPRRYQYQAPKYTRSRRAFDELPLSKQLRHLDRTKDSLAFRLWGLEQEGPEFLINCIRGNHNLSNAY